MDVFNFHAAGSVRSFPVQGPGDIRRPLKGEGGGTEEMQGRIIIVMGPQSGQDAVENQQVFRKGNRSVSKRPSFISTSRSSSFRTPPRDVELQTAPKM